MATVSRGLPQRPHLDIPKREARYLLINGAPLSPMRSTGFAGDIQNSTQRVIPRLRRRPFD